MYNFNKIRLHLTHDFFSVLYCGKVRHQQDIPETGVHVTYLPDKETVTVYTKRATLLISEQGGIFNMQKTPPLKPNIEGIYETL
jgi:hypothetical protein